MKKFCSKITKQQWRVTVPNINSSIFKRSVSREKDDLRNSPRIKKSCSGCYDIEAAQQEFEQKTSVTTTIILENYSSDSESDGDYQDATAMSEKLSSTDELDTSVYADVELSPKSNRSSYINECSGDFEVPEISFSFFEERNHEYQDVKVQRKSELKIDKIEDEKSKPTEISEITIMLTEASPELVRNRDITKLSKSTNNLFDSTSPKPKLPKYDFTKSLNSFPNYPRMMKSGSDPNISHSRLELDEDDGVYKVPGAVRRYRQSHSLNDFNMENVDLASSASSSIEHISCSQTIVNKDSDYCASSSTAMDYCETRKKMPNKKRKISFLRKPKSTAWINLRSKLDDMMTEHASKQRVGAFANKDGAINIEEMYKSSKNKCKKMLKTTGKIFQKPKKEQENVDHNTQETALPKIAPRTIKPSDIEVKLNIDNGNSDVGDNSNSSVNKTDKSDKVVALAKTVLKVPTTLGEEKLEDSLKNVFRRSKVAHETHSGFDDLRKYVKQGEDFCKELSTILQERSEAELQYAKSLSKLSVKLVRACRENVGGLNEAWRAVAIELETRSEAHRMLGTVLLDEATRPLRALNENQYKVRKQTEIVVDKSAKTLSDWRAAEAKSKKHSHACARENEKLQDHFPEVKLPKPIQPEKENTKLEGKKKKAEDAAKKADIEYYTLCVRAERARLEWESEILKGSDMFQILEEERLKNLKTVLCSYLQHVNELGPRLLEASERLSRPVAQADPGNDLATFISYRNSLQQNYEQLLPDFYCEHITLAMNRERRKQALVKLLQLFKQDIDRENKSKNGLEKLTQAITQTPNFGNDDSQQNVSEKMYHMKSMLMYLEGAKYKVQNALTELDSKPKIDHPLASYIIVMRDKSGLQQSILKVPQWLKDQMIKPENSSENKIPVDRTKADGSSDESDSGSDFSDEISIADIPLQPIAQCKALYTYKRNLDDELCLHPGDVLSVYRKQEDGWWLGECKGSVGIFPATYVEIIQT